MILNHATARAPASIGNVGVGFDILGQAFGAAFDEVSAVRDDGPGVRLGGVDGLVSHLPDQIDRNTALAAAQAVLDAAGRPCGVTLFITKGVPLAAGMGGSAASAVAAAAAVNALLGSPFSIPDLLPFALEGERVASDPPHWDNVMASLIGGLVLATRVAPARIDRLPLPEGLVTILFHPAAQIETRLARSILRPEVPMQTVIDHSRRVAAFVAGCATGRVDLMRIGLEDVLVEPQRLGLLPVLPTVQAAARGAGAIGASFSGSGPSIFAWAQDDCAAEVEAAMAAALADAGLPARAYRAPAHGDGVQIVEAPSVAAA